MPSLLPRHARPSRSGSHWFAPSGCRRDDLSPPQAKGDTATMNLEITLRVNGATHRLSVDTRTTLLAALGASVRVLGPQGERAIPLVEFYRLPGDEPQRDTVLSHGELLTSVDLPPLAFATRSHYRKVRDRASYAFALVSVAAALDVADGVVRDVRIALRA